MQTTVNNIRIYVTDEGSFINAQDVQAHVTMPDNYTGFDVSKYDNVEPETYAYTPEAVIAGVLNIRTFRDSGFFSGLQISAINHVYMNKTNRGVNAARRVDLKKKLDNANADVVSKETELSRVESALKRAEEIVNNPDQYSEGEVSNRKEQATLKRKQRDKLRKDLETLRAGRNTLEENLEAAELDSNAVVQLVQELFG